MTRIGAILLAAGASSRLGRPKQLVIYDGESLLCRTLRFLRDAGFAEPVIVLGAHAEACRAGLGPLAGLAVFNPDWRRGMGTSIARGLKELQERDPEIGAALIAVCDQPHLDTGHYLQLVQTHLSRGEPVATGYHDRPGVPAIFPASMFGSLSELGADHGAREILLSTPRLAVLPAAAAALDIDSPADVAALQSQPPGSPVTRPTRRK